MRHKTFAFFQLNNDDLSAIFCEVVYLHTYLKIFPFLCDQDFIFPYKNNKKVFRILDN